MLKPLRNTFFLIHFTLLLFSQIVYAAESDYWPCDGPIRVEAQTLNVRTGPSKKYKVIGQVHAGQIFTPDVAAPDEDEPDDGEGNGGEWTAWFRITLPSGQKGWIYGEHIGDVEPGRGSGARQPDRETLIASVQQSYLPPYTTAKGYPTIQKAFENFFEKPSWGLDELGQRVVFNGVGYMGKRPVRVAVTFGTRQSGGLAVDKIHFNDELQYLRRDDLQARIQAKGERGLEIMQGLTQGKISEEHTHDTVNVNEFLAAIYLSK